MRGTTVEKKVVEYLRGRGAAITQSDVLDSLKIDFVYSGYQSGEAKRNEGEESIAIQLTTAPTNFKKLENFVVASESRSFPYRRKLYIAIGKRGAPSQELLQLINAILLTLRYNREDEISSSAWVACVIFADCTYKMVRHEEYQQVITENMDSLTNTVAVNEVPAGTVLMGDVFMDSNFHKGYFFLKAGGKRFFVHRKEQDSSLWSEVTKRYSAGKKNFQIRFSVLEYTDEHPAQKVRMLKVLD